MAECADAQILFNPDSAYFFIQKQLNFGPRVPGTIGHSQCATFFIEKLNSYNARVEVQQFTTAQYDSTQLDLKNIIASFHPELSPRILLAAHWDTRPFADKDKTNADIPIAGANDGASGPAVLLEIARLLSALPADNLKYGVDIILFDGEDQGEPHGYQIKRTIENAGKIWWCLGSQYWSKNPHSLASKAKFGILLDMVGAPNATFYKEGGSMQFAAKYMNKVWRIARKSGFQQYFINQKVAGIMDDHIFVSKDAGIPMLNIIHLSSENEDSFPHYHHKHTDDISCINKSTLNAVGSTIVQVLVDN